MLNKKYKKIIIATFLGIYILLVGYLSIIKPIEIKIEEENKVVPETVQITPQIVVKPLSVESIQIESQIGPKALSVSGNVKNISISLIVLDKNYELEINEGLSVFETMKDLQNKKENEFSFNYKEYSGMGVFVDEINGIKGKAGAYWIYYVNGKEASVGVSKYILKSGDIITWKQE